MGRVVDKVRKCQTKLKWWSKRCFENITWGKKNTKENTKTKTKTNEGSREFGLGGEKC